MRAENMACAEKPTMAGRKRCVPLKKGIREHLERAAGVGGAVVRHGAAERVGDFRLHILEPRVFAVGADAGHQLVVGDARQQQLEVVGRRLQVGVDIAHIFRARRVNPGLQRGTEAAVAIQLQVEEVVAKPAGRAYGLEARVGRAVVDKEHARFLRRALHVVGQPPRKGGHVFGFVID